MDEIPQKSLKMPSELRKRLNIFHDPPEPNAALSVPETKHREALTDKTNVPSNFKSRSGVHDRTFGIPKLRTFLSPEPAGISKDFGRGQVKHEAASKATSNVTAKKTAEPSFPGSKSTLPAHNSARGRSKEHGLPRQHNSHSSKPEHSLSIEFQGLQPPHGPSLAPVHRTPAEQYSLKKAAAKDYSDHLTTVLPAQLTSALDKLQESHLASFEASSAALAKLNTDVEHIYRGAAQEKMVTVTNRGQPFERRVESTLGDAQLDWKRREKQELQEMETLIAELEAVEAEIAVLVKGEEYERQVEEVERHYREESEAVIQWAERELNKELEKVEWHEEKFAKFYESKRRETLELFKEQAYDDGESDGDEI